MLSYHSLPRKAVLLAVIVAKWRYSPCKIALSLNASPGNNAKKLPDASEADRETSATPELRRMIVISEAPAGRRQMQQPRKSDLVVFLPNFFGSESHRDT